MRIAYTSPVSAKALPWSSVLAATPLAAGAVWGLVQTIDKVANFRLNRKKLKEEIKKLERENVEAEGNLPGVGDATGSSVFLFENPAFLRDRLRERALWHYYEGIGEKLRYSPFEITYFDVAIRSGPLNESVVPEHNRSVRAINLDDDDQT
jgi:hypothetical protein